MNVKQTTINAYVVRAINTINNDGACNYVARLRTCQAKVLETEHFYILQSYTTCVAAIHKNTHEMFDFLRYVYGYTATSAQHIAKFANDYGAETRYTYRP